MRKSIGCIILLFLFAGSPGLGRESIREMVETMSLMDLMQVRVSSASFFDDPASLAPGSAYVADVPEMTGGAFRTTRDILYMDVPGFLVSQHVRHGTLLGVRGIWVDNNAKTVFMLDGQHLNPRMHFGYTVGMQVPLLGDIRSMEVVRGPGAILHGSGAINGFINYIPKNGADSPGGFVTVEYGGREDFLKCETGYGIDFGDDKNLFLYAGLFDADGFTDDYTADGYDRNPNRAIDPDTRVHGQKDPGMRFSAYLNYKDISWQTFYQEINPSTNADAASVAGYWHSSVFGTRPKYIHRFSKQETIEIKGGLTLMEHGAEDMPDWRGYGDAGGSEAHLSLEPVFRTTRWENHKLAMGAMAGYRRFKEKNQYFQSDYSQAFEAIDMTWQELSLFAEDRYAPLDNLILTAGVRYDYERHDLDDGPTGQEHIDNLSWRFAAALSLSSDTVLKADYQQGFRTPDARYYNSVNYLNWKIRNLGESGSYELKPETMDSLSASLIRSFFGQKLETDITGFYNDYHDLLRWGNYREVLDVDLYQALSTAYGDASGFLNTPGGITTWGYELSAKLRPRQGTEVKGSYTYTRSSQEGPNEYPYPRHMGKLGIGQYLLEKDLFLNAAAVYHQGYGRPESQGTLLTAGNRLQVDLSAAYRLTPRLKFKLIVQNLLDEAVPPPVNWMPSEGGLGYNHRFWYFSLTYTF